MVQTTPAIARHREIRSLAERLWTPGITHLVFRFMDSQRSEVHGVRRTDTTYSPVQAVLYAPVDGSGMRLRQLLRDVLAEDLDSDALASECGGWYRLALHPITGMPEHAASGPHEASRVIEHQADTY